jgi:hypothetical protein
MNPPNLPAESKKIANITNYATDVTDSTSQEI